MKRDFAIAALVFIGTFTACMFSIQQAEAKSSGVHAIVTQVAQENGISPALAHAVTRVESSYNCSARGRAGELGAMQVKPATARSVGVYGNLRDCRTGITAGMRYLRQAIARGGMSCSGISLYNRGIFARPACTGYGRKVLRNMGR
jgi:soluble lytic murein transglycosylase-like protein